MLLPNRVNERYRRQIFNRDFEKINFLLVATGTVLDKVRYVRYLNYTYPTYVIRFAHISAYSLS
jgi:hypothetical protein